MAHKTEQNDPPGDGEALKGGYAKVEIPVVTIDNTKANNSNIDHNKRNHTEHAQPGDTFKLVQKYRRQKNKTRNDGPHWIR